MESFLLVPSLLTAFIAGLISFLAPCSFVLIPTFIIYLTGKSVEEAKKGRKEIILHSLFFSLGFILVFSVLGLFIGSLVVNLNYSSLALLRKIASLFLILFGIYLVLKPFYRLETSFPSFLSFSKFRNFGVKKIKELKRKNKLLNYFGSFSLGIVLSLVWGGCVGPVLGAILSLAIFNPTQSFFLLIIYSLGMVFPLILVTFFYSFFNKYLMKISAHYHKILIIEGVLFILIGLILFFGLNLSIYLFWNS